MMNVIKVVMLILLLIVLENEAQKIKTLHKKVKFYDKLTELYNYEKDLKLEIDILVESMKKDYNDIKEKRLDELADVYLTDNYSFVEISELNKKAITKKDYEELDRLIIFRKNEIIKVLEK